jgi:regulator of nucleoside diphosphate kinase
MSLSAGAARPPVFLSVSDHRQLTAAAIRWLLEAPRLAAGLLEEVERADVVPDHALGPEVARLGSWVEYLEDGERRQGRLVLEPAGPDGLPVLSLTGAALVGLRVGATIRFPDRLGAERSATLLRVEPGPPPDVAAAQVVRSLRLFGQTG